MMNDEILEEYSNSVRRLKKQFTEAGLSEDEFRTLYFQTLQSAKKPLNKRILRKSLLKRYAIVVLLILVMFTIVINYKTLYSCASCNLQEYIYPGLKILRKLSIPVISLFPSLTAFYHETCLIHNPFFTVVDMDCWPCSTVHGIREIYDPKPVTEQHSPPFFYKTEQNEISIGELKQLYLSNRELIDNDAPKITLSETKSNIHPNEMFLQLQSGEKNFYIWKFNTMSVAKMLRQIIPRPKVVPKFGQSTERFLVIDTRQESFRMPDTECSFSFLLSLSGTRTIKLLPAEECRFQCKALKVELQEAYLLWYNWWYWRPVVQTSNGNETFIAHIGSYC